MLQFKLPEKLVTYDYDKIRNESAIQRGQSFPKPKTLLSLEKTTKNGNHLVPVLTAGNLSAIQGKAKARKTFFICLLNQFLYFQSNLKIVIFDTEQSDFHSSLTRHRIDKMSDNNIDLEFFRLRKYTRDVNLDFINDHIVRTKPDLVFIDNIRDCMSDINSNTETTMILKVLKQIIDEYGTHVCVTLHENPYKDNDKARGVIGTELQNACETIFKIEKLKDVRYTKITGFFTRNGDFDDLMFIINNEGIPVLTTEVPVDEPF
jgi:archaellum biogenesis ATPase FlaH